MLREQELAVPATIAGDASTYVAVVPLVARGTVVAGVVFTAANGGAAVAAGVTWWASAAVAV